MKTYRVQATEKFTGYRIAVFYVEANSEEEAKQNLIESEVSEAVDAWDVETEDYEFIEPETWTVTERED